ncbi:Hint domain-containing protein [Rhodovulum sp. ES.010]|uniref:Hint domain-containing protein n=1 Tax=Rhodovulum sp. ES.010 TaxID=1882821 RepID=UPI000928DD8B|nr:Hint domain-containing protein [Rhodovulum sp. ES.010]SIO44576.1 Hint domain-containing protein [Rhodovulum sp. ES.010]
MEVRIAFEGSEPVTDARGAPVSRTTPAPGAIAGIASGFAAGTEIATTHGWRPVEALAPGVRVLTFDHGAQPVRAVQRGLLWRGWARCPQPLWPLTVPEGALGNSAPLTLLPEQSVLVESDLAEELYGDPFVLIQARYLEGVLGIHRVAPTLGRPVEVIVPLFDRPEITFANGAALVFCPAQGEGEPVPLHRLCEMQTANEIDYGRPCAPHEARRLAAALQCEVAPARDGPGMRAFQAA